MNVQNKKKILVVGDIILDIYQPISITRKAQEANIDIYDEVGRAETLPGGAANVMNNIKSLADDIDVELAGISEYYFEHDLVIPGDNLTKLRYHIGEKILCRVDNRKKFLDNHIEIFENRFLQEDLTKYNLIVISDYDKGTVTNKVINHIKRSGVRTVVDSKRYDLSIFNGLYALNVNEHEYNLQSSNKEYFCIESLFQHVIITLGEKGCEHHQYDYKMSYGNKYVIHSELFPTKKVDVVDVTGCGDTHTAAFAIGITRDDFNIRQAIQYANICATIAVQKFKTARITKWDFLKTLNQE